MNTVVGDVSGSVVQGRDITVYLQPRQPAALPVRFGRVPPLAGCFQRRELVDFGGSVRVIVLSGLGGVGKTQLAADHAQRAWQHRAVDLVAWIAGGSRTSVVSDYARLAAELTGIEDRDPEHGARRLLDWLASTEHRWLLVIDDARAPAVLAGLWPPLTPTGTTLITTRRRDAALRGDGRRIIDVTTFTLAESMAYLTATLAERPELADGAADLAAALGHLPLALAQAGAYLIDRGFNCAAYLRRFLDRSRTLASLVPDDDALPDEHRLPLGTTWSLSVEAANRLAPAGLAGPLLNIAALLDANGIPLSVFGARPVLSYLAATLGRDVAAEHIHDGLACLRRLSLLTVDPEAEPLAVRVHALVQRATRDQLAERLLPDLASAVADALRDSWPSVQRDTALIVALRTNTAALHAAARAHLWSPDGHEVLFLAAESVRRAGQAVAARDQFAHLRAAAAEHLGPDHPDTLLARHHLARCHAEVGDPAGAADALAEVLADRIRVLGANHPDTLSTRHHLARCRGEAGDPMGAADALAGVLADRVRVLGADHPDTLTIRHNRASFQGQAGDAAGAVAAFAELLPDRARVLGPDHIDTLITRHSLAFWRGQAGDPAGALADFTELNADQVRILGADHHSTLITRGNVARCLGEVGDAAGAADAFAELLANRLRVLGPDHPSTLVTRHNLAYWRGKSGDPAGAAAAFTELLADRTRVLGPDHPSTLATRHNLACCRGEVGDAVGAVAALAEVLADQVRVLGPDHPYTLRTADSLAQWRDAAGQERSDPARH